MRSLLGVVLLGLLFVALQRLPEGESRRSPDIGLLAPYQTPTNPAGFQLLRLVKSTHTAAILFIPGHRGHANQVLPLAEQIYEVDVYVTDFNEAPSALSPALLWLEAVGKGECKPTSGPVPGPSGHCGALHGRSGCLFSPNCPRSRPTTLPSPLQSLRTAPSGH